MITWWQSLLLGAVQGATEFLPVSSSGHLVLLQTFLGVELPISYDVMLHAGTLVAVLLYFGARLPGLVKRYWLQLLLATIPAAMAGVFFEEKLLPLFELPLVVCGGLLVTTMANLISHRLSVGPRAHAQLTPVRALGVGLVQAVAIVPGISRSGSTLAAGLSLGLSKQDAFDLSFLMSIPVILGAVVLSLKDLSGVGDNWVNYGLGVVVATVVGLASLKLLSLVLVSNLFRYFAGYTLILSVVSFLLLT